MPFLASPSLAKSRSRPQGALRTDGALSGDKSAVASGAFHARVYARCSMYVFCMFGTAVLAVLAVLAARIDCGRRSQYAHVLIRA